MENEIVVFASDDIGRSSGLKVKSCGTLMYLLFQFVKKTELNRKQSLERGKKPSRVNVVQFLSSASAGDLRERGSAATMLWFPPG